MEFKHHQMPKTLFQNAKSIFNYHTRLTVSIIEILLLYMTCLNDILNIRELWILLKHPWYYIKTRDNQINELKYMHETNSITCKDTKKHSIGITNGLSSDGYLMGTVYISTFNFMCRCSRRNVRLRLESLQGIRFKIIL